MAPRPRPGSWGGVRRRLTNGVNRAFPAKLFHTHQHLKPMSTASQSQLNIAKLDHELNQAILSGDILNAFEKYYANDVVMQENDSDPFKGKEVNRKREQEFVNSVEQFHGAKLLGEAVNGDASFSEWKSCSVY